MPNTTTNPNRCHHCGLAIQYNENDGTYRGILGEEECERGWPGGYPRLHEPG